MNKTQTKIEVERYVAPAMNEHVLAVRKCIATSPTSSGNLNNWSEDDTYEDFSWN